MAAEGGSAEVVAELAGRGADVEAERDGRSPLWIAVQAARPPAPARSSPPAPTRGAR